MRSFFVALLWIVLLLPQEGCFFGTFQTARTLAPGEVDAGWFLTYPLYFNRNVREKSEAEGLGSFDSRPNVGGFMAYGASPILDVGLWGSLGEGVGPFAKLQFLGGASPLPSPIDGALWAGFGYHPVVDGITGKVAVIGGARLSEFSTLYFGWMGVNLPDYRKLQLPYDGTLWSHLRDLGTFKFFHALFLGVDVARRSDVEPRYQRLPFGISMEFTLPLVRYPALFFGVQLKR